ncbi:peptide ABC transporter permease [Devosia sp. Leaf420]|uniref:ABC transporter permease n=1 Tax=Devosia sp. Leaf420 TaxID=1736374 RepID=UPI000715B83A|nr:ABC transporter permease [Devosia sp. Leaf420]KQT42836.1 peptide ABC transporter permease [Devosia sp. Leaf420]
MASYLLKRLAGLALVLLVMSFIVFCLQSIIPADPARSLAGPSAPQETVDQLRQDMGLNDPLLVQYGSFVSRLTQGDLGTSIRTRQPIAEDVLRYGPATLELIIAAMLMGTALAFILAFAQATLQRSGGVRVGMLALGSVPIFLTALLLAYFLWFRLGWFPGSGRLDIRRFSGPTGFFVLDGLLLGRPEVSLSALRHLFLPALALSVPIAVSVGRSLSSALVDVMRQPYIRTASGKGLGAGYIFLRHGLRNAASAPLAMLGLQVGLLFGNLLIVERVFAWPGLGLYTVQSFATSDLPAVLGVALVFGAFYILVTMLVEIAQSLADPRIAL